MKKYPLTQAGIIDFYNGLSKYNDAQLLKEGIEIAEDFRAYMHSRFEIDIFLLESIRSLDKKIVCSLGWCLAAVLVNREPFSIKGPLLTTLISLKADIAGHIIALDCPIALRVT